MTIAYLINQYPKVSHSFIRREIAALEVMGLPIARFSLRSRASELVDAADKLELEKTRVVLSVGIWGLLVNLFAVAFAHPRRCWQAFLLTCKVGWKSERGIWRHFAYLAEACVLVRWFSQAKISHIHAHFGTNSTTVAMLCSLLAEIPYSFTIHGPEEFDKAVIIALEEKIKRAAFVVAISYFCRSQIYRRCDWRQWSKIHVIHCGIDDNSLQQSPVTIPNVATLVCTGRLSLDKGQILLIKAARQLADEGLEFKIILVGDGLLRQELEREIQAFGLSENIKITGWATSSEVQNYITNSRVFVLPSLAEGLPVALMEALALGRPVISTYVAGIPELVEQGKHGWLIPAGSVAALTEAMRQAIQCPVAELARMGRAGRERVAQQYNAAVEARKLAALLS